MHGVARNPQLFPPHYSKIQYLLTQLRMHFCVIVHCLKTYCICLSFLYLFLGSSPHPQKKIICSLNIIANFLQNSCWEYLIAPSEFLFEFYLWNLPPTHPREELLVSISNNTKRISFRIGFFQPSRPPTRRTLGENI